MWELPKIILMILVSLSFITFSIHKFKIKYKKDFLFFSIWFFISIFKQQIHPVESIESTPAIKNRTAFRIYVLIYQTDILIVMIILLQYRIFRKCT